MSTSVKTLTTPSITDRKVKDWQSLIEKKLADLTTAGVVKSCSCQISKNESDKGPKGTYLEICIVGKKQTEVFSVDNQRQVWTSKEEFGQTWWTRTSASFNGTAFEVLVKRTLTPAPAYKPTDYAQIWEAQQAIWRQTRRSR